MAMILPFSQVMRLIDAANVRRRSSRGESDMLADLDAPDPEWELNERFRTKTALAVYGTLAPGERNHHVVAPLGGSWTPGLVHGDLVVSGWGAELGYPALRPRIRGPAVSVRVLAAAGLADAWPALDELEGSEYQRVLVPVLVAGSERGPRLLTVANLYAAAEAST